MQSLDRKATDKILQAGIDYLKQPGRKIATIGFSMGGQESLNANLNDPEAVNASVMISVKDGCGARRTELRGDRYGGKKPKWRRGREVDRRSTNPFWMVGCRVTAKAEGRVFACGLSYGLRMKTSAGSLNRELNLRTCSSVSFRCPARNIETALSDPNSDVKSRCIRPCCSMRNRTTETASASGIA
jgi:hypothetical protein